jgi:hypothetical protein
MAELVDERDDRPGHRRVFAAQHPQRREGFHRGSLLLQLAGPGIAVAGLAAHHGDGDDMSADRQRCGDGVLGQPRHLRYRHDHHGGLGGRLSRNAAQAQRLAGTLVIAEIRVNRMISAGTVTTTTHAPAVNLVTRKITVAAAVTRAPRP